MNGVNAQIQAAIAYYFIRSLDAEQRKNLLLPIIGEVLKRDIEISNITFDGLPANAPMCDRLGANLDLFDSHTYFIEPSKHRRIHIILDPSHCIKLVRNNFANYGTLYDADNNEIKWEYLVKLVEFSDKGNFGMCHKLNKRHINFKDRIMHVRTAVETLSNSVADSMQFLLNQNNEEFAHAGPTIQFIRTFNDVFDVMNTQRVMHEHPNQLKTALNPFNKDEVLTLLKMARVYIMSLKINDGRKLVPAVESPIKAGFRGFVVNIDSISAMYTKYIEHDKDMIMLPTYRFSQDHLEMFFHKVRSRNGCNENPTVLQFSFSYKHLQLITDLTITSGANVSLLAASNILVVSSYGQRKQTAIPPIEEEAEEESEDESIAILENIHRDEYLIDKCNKSSVTFVAYKIEQSLLQCEHIYCDLCRRVLLENEKVDRRDCIGGKSPCKSTYAICKEADLAIKRNIGSNNLKNRVIGSVVSNLNIDHLYSRYFPPEHDITHKNYTINPVSSCE